MTYSILRGTVMFAAVALALAAGAHAQTASLQCQARTLRNQSQFYHCLARCDHRMAAQPQTAADVLQVRQARCEAGCEARSSKRLEHIMSTPPCQAIVIPPNPSECEALYLGVEASNMVCQSRCTHRANPANCQTTCTTRYETDLDRVKADPVCQNGPATSPLAPGNS